MRVIPCAIVPVLLFWAPRPQDPEGPAQMLQRAQQLARTAEPHQHLLSLVGSWNVAVHSTVPGQPESNDRGTVVGKAILGDRYVVLNSRLVMQGRAIEGVQILGFDNLTQQYTSSWRDDGSTWAVECRGAAEPKHPTQLRLQGQLQDARDPTGRAFRLEIDLPESGAASAVAKLRYYDAFESGERLVQEQVWTR